MLTVIKERNFRWKADIGGYRDSRNEVCSAMKEPCRGEREMRSAEAPEDARVRVLVAEDHALVRDGIR